MEAVAFSGEVRTDLGKKGTRAARNAGHTPCVLYGGKETLHFSINIKEAKNLIYTSDFKIAEITINGNVHKAILKEIQFHPVSDEVLHLDFVELVDGKRVNVEIPVRFQGSSPGEKVGGKLLQKLRRAKVQTTPEHLVDTLYVDISTLEMGQSVRVKDIILNDNIDMMISPNLPVATIEVPRAMRSAQAAAAKDGEEDDVEE